MYFANHTTSRSLLRPSSTREPSGPPSEVIESSRSPLSGFGSFEAGFRGRQTLSVPFDRRAFVNITGLRAMGSVTGTRGRFLGRAFINISQVSEPWAR